MSTFIFTADYCIVPISPLPINRRKNRLPENIRKNQKIFPNPTRKSSLTFPDISERHGKSFWKTPENVWFSVNSEHGHIRVYSRHIYIQLLCRQLLVASHFHPVLFSYTCLLYTSPSPRDRTRSRMPSSA